MNTAKTKNYRKDVFLRRGFKGQSAEVSTKVDAKFTSKLNLRLFTEFLRLCSVKSKLFMLRIFKRYYKQIYTLSVLFIIALLQSTLLNYFRIFNVKPDVILATLIILVPFFSLRWSVAFAFLVGVFRDIFSILPFGFNAVIYILWIILAKQITRRLSIENKFTYGALLCLIILLNNFAIESFLFIVDRPVVIGTFLKIVSLECIFTLLLALPMYRFFVHLFKASEGSLNIKSEAFD